MILKAAQLWRSSVCFLSLSSQSLPLGFAFENSKHVRQ